MEKNVKLQKNELDALTKKLIASLKESKEIIQEIENNGYKVKVSPFFRHGDSIKVELDISETINV